MADNPAPSKPATPPAETTGPAPIAARPLVAEIGPPEVAPAVPPPVKADAGHDAAPLPSGGAPAAKSAPKPGRAAAAPQRSAARLAEDPRAVAQAAGLNDGEVSEPLAAAEAFVAATQEFTHPAALVQPVAAVLEARFGPKALAASQSLLELNTKILDLWRAQAESTMSLWQGMVGVTTLSEAVQLQTSHLRKHYEDTHRRAKDIAQTAVRMASGLAPEAKVEILPPPKGR